MQKNGVVRLVTAMKVNYRYTFRDMTKEEMTLMVETWYDMLSPYTDEEVQGAFRVALCKCKMPPTLADIIGILTRQEELKAPTDAEYWTELMNALEEIKEPVYDEEFYQELPFYVKHKAETEKVYATLSEPVKRIVDFSTFLDYARESAEELRYERARFLKAIPDVRETLREKKIIAGNNPLLSGGERMFLPEEN